jgi:transposase
VATLQIPTTPAGYQQLLGWANGLGCPSTVPAGAVTVMAKTGTGPLEMIRCLQVARITAIRARTQTINALKGLLVTAPPSSASSSAAGRRPGWWRPRPTWSRPAHQPVGRGYPRPGSLARRHQALSAEIGPLTLWVADLT